MCLPGLNIPVGDIYPRKGFLVNNMYKVVANPIRVGASLSLMRGATRRFRISACLNAASLFKMPAMSPTMTEGGIVSWKVKAGDKFSAGDVLLEVETDKATIDVEALDDGILWEVLEQEGASGIPVGKTIAYLAEPGDDLATLEKPKEEQTSSQEQPKEEKAAEKSSTAQPSPARDTKAQSQPPSSKSEKSKSGVFTTANPNQKLFPSVELLLHENGISVEDALEKIPASGPKGRLLKGDVLAFLGRISSESVESIAKFISLREHLDLSNIQIAQPEAPKQESKEEVADVKPSNVVSFNAVYELNDELTTSDFILDFEKAIQDAKQLAYAEQFPEFATTPSPSLLGSSSDLFDDIVSPPVTTPRFQVQNLKFDFKKASLSNITTSGDLFDEIISTPSKAIIKDLSESSDSRKVSVKFDVKFDEGLVDSALFVNNFEDNLLTIIPPKELVVA